MNELKEKDTIIIQAYTPNYYGQTIEILGLMWKQLSVEERELLFNWRYLNNPYTEENFVFIAICNGEVIGIAPYVVEKFLFGEKPLLVLAAADTVIKESFQGRGVYAKLAKHAMDYISLNSDRLQFGVYLNLSSNENSTPACLKIGWKALAPRAYIYRFSLPNIVRAKLSIKANIADFLVKHSGEYKLEASKKLKVDELVIIAEKNKAAIKNNRDIVYYNWKFSFRIDSFRYYYCYRGDSLVAYVILENKGNQYGTMEYGFTDEKALAKLFIFAQRHLKTGIIGHYYMHLLPIESSAFRRAMFLSEPKYLQRKLKLHRFPVLIRLKELDCTGKEEEFGGINPLMPSNWSLTKADVY